VIKHRRVRYRRSPPPTRRTRLPAAVRGVVTKITVGPSDMIQHNLPVDTNNCWLVQYEGRGYRDWDRCWDKQGIESLLSLFRAAYPNSHVTWLKILRE
jgi:hypothetical protein